MTESEERKSELTSETRPAGAGSTGTTGRTDGAVAGAGTDMHETHHVQPTGASEPESGVGTSRPEAGTDPEAQPDPEPAAEARTETKAESKGETKAAAKPRSTAGSKAESGERKKEKGASPVPAMVSTVRTYVSRIIWIICVLAALVLAVGALLIALHANKHNGLVKGVLDLAKVADVGLFSLDSPIKQFDPPHAHIKVALLNYGIGALAWLVVGRIVASLVRPRS